MAKNGILATARSWFGKSEKRDITPQLTSDPLFSIFGTSVNNNEQGLKLATASRAISLISSSFGAADVQLYRQTASGTPEVVREHPLADLMANGTADLSAYSLKANLMESLLSYGESFALIDFDNQGRLQNITPLDWHNVCVETLGNGRRQYRVSDPLRSYVQTLYQQDRIFHAVHRPGQDGRGRSPLSLAALSASVSVGTELAVADSANNGFRAAGILSSDTAISDTTAARLKAGWEKYTNGGGGAGKVVVAGDGLKFSQISANNADADINELRKLDAYFTAAAYGCPPESVGLVFESSWNSAAEATRNLVTMALEPWSQSLCQQLCAFVLGRQARRSLYLAANWEALTAGSLQDKSSAYGSLVTNAIFTRNEARAKFDLPAIEGGDELVTTAATPNAGSKPVVATAGASS